MRPNLQPVKPLIVTNAPIGHTDIEAVRAQVALEAEATTAGMVRWWKGVQKAREEGREHETGYGAKLIKMSLEQTAEAIDRWRAEEMARQKGQGGKVHSATRYLPLLDSKRAAFIGLRCALRSITSKQTVQNAAVRIGTEFELEYGLSKLCKESKGEYYDLVKLAEQHTIGGDDAVKTYRTYLKNNTTYHPNWPRNDILHLGTKILDIIRQATGLIEVQRRENDLYELIATPECLAWIRKSGDILPFLQPAYQPCVIPPRDWEDTATGGFWSSHLARFPLIKSRSKPYLEEMRHRSMPAVLEAVNALQRTGWQVNSAVLEVMERVWERGGAVAGFPPASPIPLPVCPICKAAMEAKPRTWRSKDHAPHVCFTVPEHKETLLGWRREAARTYRANAENSSKIMLTTTIIRMARKFAEYPSIYYVHQCDFRGRMYAVANYLNPQGCDQAKGVLRFAEGKPLGTQTAADWLAIHGANSFGVDKVSFAERVQWVHDNEAMILAVANDPLSVHEWEDADSPWQFLAWCFEWAGYKREGLGFVSHLSIGQDGSCNGIQHYSAILRDEVGGAATNLTPQDKPADIYAEVAAVVVRKLELLQTTGKLVMKKPKEKDGEPIPWYDERDMAKGWLAIGITRKTTKRQVMVLPYGGTARSCHGYTREHLEERMKEGLETPWGRDAFSPSHFLSGIIWESIGEVVIGARAAMTWLQQVAYTVAKAELPIAWTVPGTGFLVQQWYKAVSNRRVKLRVGTRLVYMSLRNEGNDIDVSRQTNGIAPNVIHSFDAACCMLTTQRCANAGIKSFHMVHDSYGTHAADSEFLAKALREVFVEFYTADVLDHWLGEILDEFPHLEEKLTAIQVPPTGYLDLEQVKQSLYFFA